FVPQPSGKDQQMSRSRLVKLSLALAVAGVALGGSIARAETDADMERDLVPAQKPLYDLGANTTHSPLAVDAWVDKPELTYAVGQELKVFVRPKQTSYITVLNVGTSGSVAVIFPNFFQRETQVSAAQTIKIPSDKAVWKIDVAGPPGVEVI